MILKWDYTTPFISTRPDNRRLGVATKMYDARKTLAIKLNLRRIMTGGIFCFKKEKSNHIHI